MSDADNIKVNKKLKRLNNLRKYLDDFRDFRDDLNKSHINDIKSLITARENTLNTLYNKENNIINKLQSPATVGVEIPALIKFYIKNYMDLLKSYENNMLNNFDRSKKFFLVDKLSKAKQFEKLREEIAEIENTQKSTGSSAELNELIDSVEKGNNKIILSSLNQYKTGTTNETQNIIKLIETQLKSQQAQTDQDIKNKQEILEKINKFKTSLNKEDTALIASIKLITDYDNILDEINKSNTKYTSDFKDELSNIQINKNGKNIHGAFNKLDESVQTDITDFIKSLEREAN
jgi:hypothetical protein